MWIVLAVLAVCAIFGMRIPQILLVSFVLAVTWFLTSVGAFAVMDLTLAQFMITSLALVFAGAAVGHFFQRRKPN